MPIECYNMFEELLKCKDLLSKFGGHPMAAGLSLEEENIDLLSKRLNQVTDLTEEDLIPRITLDMGLPLDYIDYGLIEDLEKLEPFGKGNHKPIFGEKDIKVLRASILGQNRNVLKLRLLSKGGTTMDGIYFGDIGEFEDIIRRKYGSEALEKLYQGMSSDISVDLAFYPSINEFRGNKSIQIVIESFR